MKKLILLLLVTLSLLSLSAIIEETGSFRGFLYGVQENIEYDDYISHVSEGIASVNYNLYAPFDPQTNGFGDFITPNSTQLTNWETISEAFVAGNYEQAQTLINNYGYPYHVVQFNDTDTDRTYYLLRELLNNDVDENIESDPNDTVTGSFDYGWGLYVFNPEATNPIIVTVPHPTDDFPTIVIGYHSFMEWDSMFLLVSGAGREVTWTNVNPYYNSKSISDPTRNVNHPYNKSYRVFCDHIRETFGRVEFSPQMHSYDWGERHTGYAACQISAGRYEYCPNLPLRDLSGNGLDLLNQTPAVLWPANTFGTHREVTRNDYYAIHSTVYDYDIVGEPDNPVNTSVDLMGYSQNRQMQYTLAGKTDYDVFDPFFHIELDELPEVYDQTEENYFWFWGYDPLTQTFPREKVFEMTENFYLHWIHTIRDNLDNVLGLSDVLTPATPQNLAIFAQNYNAITVEWEPVNDFNFKSYEVLYATEPIGTDNYELFTREDDELLASMRTSQIEVTGLDLDTEYFFKVRAVDYSDNTSAPSDEVSISTAPYKIASFTARGLDGQVKLNWVTQNEVGIGRYKVYRKEADSAWTVVDNNVVAGNDSYNSYEWFDDTVEYNHYYTYKLEVYNMASTSYQYDYEVDAHVSDYMKLLLTNSSGSASDSVEFSFNAAASDGYDSFYDITTSSSGSGTYILACFYEQYYENGQRYLSREVDGDLDLTQDFKSMKLAVKTNQTNQIISINLADVADTRFSQKVWLNGGSGNYVDLTEEPLQFIATNSNFKYFDLYVGNINPTINIASHTGHELYQVGDLMTLQWTCANGGLLDYYRIDLISETDSINVDDNLDVDNTYYPWTIPAGTEIHDAKLVVTAYAIDGEVRRYESDWEVGILPVEIDYTFDAGWQMVSHVWETGTVTANTLFGPGFELFTFNPAQQYEGTLFYSYGAGYWVNVAEDITTAIDGDITNEDYTVTVNPGWNLLGNPYPSDLDINSLIFEVDGVEYTIGEMITFNFISRGIYVHRENGYELATTINSAEAFFLYSELTDFQAVTLTYEPYIDNYTVETLPVNWSFTVVADNGTDRDNVLLGASDYATENYDLNLDFIKPPVKPYDGVNLSVLYADDDLSHSYDRGHIDYKAMFTEDEEVVRWNVGLEVSDLEPVQFSFNSEDFPVSILFSYIEYNGEMFYFDMDNDFELVPTEIGEISLDVVVSTYPLSNDNGVEPVQTYFSIYPNPFNPETTIAFNLKNDANVEVNIYNIRGQKVKCLQKGEMNAGRKTIVWDGTNRENNRTASGVYFVRLKTSGEKTRVKKVMLMK